MAGEQRSARSIEAINRQALALPLALRIDTGVGPAIPNQQTSDDGDPSPQRMRAIALLAAATMFMEGLDGTIVAIALPAMAGHFRAGVVDMNVGMTAYLVSLAVLLPLSNWAAGRWGPRAVFAAAVGLFTLASLACALSPTLPCFVMARVVQGASAAMMTPVGRVVVLMFTRKSEVMKAVALLTWPALIAPAIAPPLGALIVEHLSWQWIFLINLPIGLVGVIAALRLLPRRLPDHPGGGADWFGLALWAIAATLLVGGVESAERVSAATLAALLGGGAVAAVLGWRHFRNTERPLLDIKLIGGHRSLSTAMIEGSAFRTAIMANPFLLPLYFQVGLGKSVAETGLIIMIGMGGNIGMKAVTSFILNRVGFRRVLSLNGLLLGASFAAFAWTDRDTPFAVLAAMLLVSGLLRSLQFTALNTLAFADVAKGEIAPANTLLGTAVQLNGAMGVAVGALAVQIGSRWFGVHSLGAFHAAFATIAVISAVAAISCLRYDRAIGSQILTRPNRKPANA